MAYLTFSRSGMAAPRRLACLTGICWAGVLLGRRRFVAAPVLTSADWPDGRRRAGSDASPAPSGPTALRRPISGWPYFGVAGRPAGRPAGQARADTVFLFWSALFCLATVVGPLPADRARQAKNPAGDV